VRKRILNAKQKIISKTLNNKITLSAHFWTGFAKLEVSGAAAHCFSSFFNTITSTSREVGRKLGENFFLEFPTTHLI